MPAVLRMQQAQLAFGQAPILDNVDLVIESGERVCLVGRNGAGKSTMMKVIGGDAQLDDGIVQAVGDAKIARLPQDPPANSDQRVYDYVAAGLAETGNLLKQFHELSKQMVEHPEDESLLRKLSNVQSQLDAVNGWQAGTRIEHVLTRLELDADQTMANLSGGWLRRVALAQALVLEPDLLLLDEPTNHLDIEMVQWLEKAILEFKGAVLFISHDRAFIRRLATRIIDLDRGRLVSFPGDYDQYLLKKQELLEIEDAQNAEFDKKLAQEEVWVRQGIKARRTRNEGRVRALKTLREERMARRERQGSANLQINQGQRSGKLVFEGQDLSLTFDHKTILKSFNLILTRGDKIALVGPNGCGKSTLINVILGRQEINSGKIKTGVNLEVAYFDQHRDQLDPELSLADNVGDGKQDVTYNGRTRHILSYLQDFLFTPKQSRTPVHALSGGERNRALLAKLFLKPSNVLVLDEPTNDLDVDTLELLEQIVSQYDGTVIVVSHDREFIDNTATSILLFEGEGRVTEIFGGFQEVEHYRATQRALETKATSSGTKTGLKQSEAEVSAVTPSNGGGQPRKKLSYKLQRELELLPENIEALEREQEELLETTNAADFYSQPITVTEPVLQRMAAVEEELMQALERWDELEQLQQESR